MSDISTVGTRFNGADMEFYDKASGTTLLAFRNAASPLNPLGVAAVDMSSAPGVLGFGQYQKIVLTAAQVLAMFGAPITLLPAPGAGLANVLLDCTFFLNHVTGAFAAGGLVEIIQNSITQITTSATLINNASSILIQPAWPGVGTTQSNGAANSATTITNATQAFTGGGASTLEVHLWYATIIVP